MVARDKKIHLSLDTNDWIFFFKFKLFNDVLIFGANTACVVKREMDVSKGQLRSHHSSLLSREQGQPAQDICYRSGGRGLAEEVTIAATMFW